EGKVARGEATTGLWIFPSNPRRSFSASQVDAGYQALLCHSTQLPTTEVPPVLSVTWSSQMLPGRRPVTLASICVPHGSFRYRTVRCAPAAGPALMVLCQAEDTGLDGCDCRRLVTAEPPATATSATAAAAASPRHRRIRRTLAVRPSSDVSISGDGIPVSSGSCSAVARRSASATGTLRSRAGSPARLA